MSPEPPVATAFMNVGGPGDARLAIVIEGHADRCWDEAFPAGPGRPWHTGTATFRTRAGAKSPRDVRRQVLHREVAERLLDNDVRHHVVLNAQEAPELMLPDGCVLVLGALEVLHIGTQSVPGTAFMVVVHARAASLPQRALHDLFQSRYRENLLAVVEDLLGAHTTHDVGGGPARAGAVPRRRLPPRPSAEDLTRARAVPSGTRAAVSEDLTRVTALDCAGRRRTKGPQAGTRGPSRRRSVRRWERARTTRRTRGCRCSRHNASALYHRYPVRRRRPRKNESMPLPVRPACAPTEPPTQNRLSS